VGNGFVKPRRKVGLALAGGGPFGAIYEVGALMALEDALDGVQLHELDCYVGVSAGGFLAAALANGIPIREIHRIFILDGEGDGAFTPGVFMRPAWREYLARASRLPGLAARTAWRWVSQGASPASLESFAALGQLVPTGLFDNQPIDRYLESIFSRPGRTNDFRALERKLFVVATDLDRGESVTFGREGHDDVPISRAVQASSALPGLFPPVQIDGRFFVDGALRKTMHASEALEEGAELVLCVNPIVPYDARLGMRKGGEAGSRLAEGGLPVVLSQTFRAVIHSRMTVGLAKYRGQYPGADVVLFEPEPDDHEIFFTSLFSYAARQAVCEHAYETTRADLVRRAPVLEPLLERHGITMRWEVLEATDGAMPPAMPRRAGRVGRAAAELDAALRDLHRVIGFAPCSPNPTATRSARSGRGPGS
jgi:NTE family protein